MTDNFTTENDEKANKIVELLLNGSKLKDVIKNEQEKKQLSPILKKVVLSKDKVEIKKNIKELIGKLKEFGVKIYTNQKTSVPVLWSNGRPISILKKQDYNSEFYHHDDTSSPLFQILWEIMANLTHDDRSFIKDSYCHQLYNDGDSIRVKHIPYDRLLSEIWVEEIPLDTILEGNIRIEFGQNEEGRETDKVYSATNSVLIVSELPILLDRIAKHNLDMDLAGTPEKKVYLENIGVSFDEIIRRKYKTINERYSDGRNNEDAGWIVLRKVKRDSYSEDGEIYGEYTKTPVKLKSLILKLEKLRLKEIQRRLVSLREKIIEGITITDKKIIKDIKDENSNIANIFAHNEKQQHSFIREARREEEVNYVMKKYFSKIGEKSKGEENSFSEITTTKDENALIAEKEGNRSNLGKLLMFMTKSVTDCFSKIQLIKDLGDRLLKFLNLLNMNTHKNKEETTIKKIVEKTPREKLLDKFKEIDSNNKEMLEELNKDLRSSDLKTQKKILEELDNKIGKKTIVTAIDTDGTRL